LKQNGARTAAQQDARRIRGVIAPR
jgi:hypothetical protein